MLPNFWEIAHFFSGYSCFDYCFDVELIRRRLVNKHGATEYDYKGPKPELPVFAALLLCIFSPTLLLHVVVFCDAAVYTDLLALVQLAVCVSSGDAFVMT